MQGYKYFDRRSSEWDILGFLNESDDIEPFNLKVDCYTKCLETIANCEKGFRSERAQLLLDKYKKGTRPDRQLARKWETERALKQIHYHQPTFTGINGDINGTVTAENFVAGVSERNTKKRNQDNKKDQEQNARKRNKLISKDHINDSQGQTSTNDDESAVENIELNLANVDTPDYETITRECSSDEMGESSENNIPNDSDSNETMEIKHNDLEELEQQITFRSLNEWEVGTVNVSRKFKEYQRQLIASIRRRETKLTWNNTFELLALSSIIVMCWPCPYSTFTSSEWRQVLNSNPHKITQPILTDSLLTTFYKATNDVSLGLNCNNFTLNDDDSELGEKAGRIFNYIKGELPLSSKQKETENKHCVYNLDPFIKIIFGGEYTPYTLELNKSVNGKQRPDFSCVIDDIAILNSEIKPSGYTQLRRNQDFVKVHLKGRKSINKLLETGGLTKQLLF